MSVSACRRNHSGMWRIWNTVECFPASLEKKSIRHTVEHGNPIHLGSTFLETLPRNLHIDPYNLQSIYSIYKNEKYTSFILQICRFTFLYRFIPRSHNVLTNVCLFIPDSPSQTLIVWSQLQLRISLSSHHNTDDTASVWPVIVINGV
jgi:hypothetical protein